MIVGGKHNLIGISGKIGSGKDTLGSILQDYSDDDYQIKKFADTIKNTVCMWIGCTRAQLEDQKFKETELGEEWTKYRIITKGLPNYYVSTLEEAEANVRHSNQRYVKVMMTPRLMLQLLGTEAGREIMHPNIWVNSLFADYVCNDCGKQVCSIDEEDTGQMIHYSYPNWIVTDVRFPNEAKAIKDRGGIVIRINRPLYRLNEQHASETALDNYEFDHVIENDGSLDELITKIKLIKDE